MSTSLLVIGAGAIGRGFLPWVFPSGQIRWHYVDANPALVAQMRKAGGYHCYRVQEGQYEERWVPVAEAWTPAEWLQAGKPGLKNMAAVWINVGPRHAVEAAHLAEGYAGPVILSENDPATVKWVLDSAAVANAFFAVPDVITSNSAPDHLLAADPLAVVTENGQMFMDQGVHALAPGLTTALGGNIRYLGSDELLNEQWIAKLYLHNTPHCVVAYLGALAGARYIHEAMQMPGVEKIVVGAMNEMLNSLKLRWEVPHEFLDWYAAKELSRFRCPQLFDPIARVAREPLRKLETEGRLLGAAQICLSMGFVPENVLLGIGSALLFENREDADYHLVLMRRAMSSSVLLTYVLGLRRGEALERVLRERFDWIVSRLTEISRPGGRV